MTAAALRADRKVADELFRRHFPPAVAAVFAYLVRHAAHTVSREYDFAAVFAVEGRNGYAPCTLAADTPVGTVAHHVRDAVFAPVGHPLDFVDMLERLVTEIGDGDEPLVRGAEDDGLFAAPAVRVGMGYFEFAEQAFRFSEELRCV